MLSRSSMTAFAKHPMRWRFFIASFLSDSVKESKIQNQLLVSCTTKIKILSVKRFWKTIFVVDSSADFVLSMLLNHNVCLILLVSHTVVITIVVSLVASHVSGWRDDVLLRVGTLNFNLLIASLWKVLVPAIYTISDSQIYCYV